jgi:polysaccharide deacetylase 2 family uncharacterized protein YibQ
LNAATPRTWGHRIAGSALLGAWLLLLGGLGALVGYVMFLPETERAEPPAVRVLVLDLPPPEIPAEQKTASQEPAPAPAPAQVAEALPKVEAPLPADEPQQHAAAEPKAAEPAAPVQESQTGPPAEPQATQEAALPRAPELEALPAWKRHAQPFEAQDTRPRIAVVITGLGLSSAATEAAIKGLPGPISLSFTPYSRRLNEWIALARVNGHEVLLDLPMEPTSYPNDDPGPQALLTALSSRQNLERLDWALRRATGFVGVTAVMGSRFLASEEHMMPILTELKERGLLFLDNRDSETSVAGPLAQKLGLANAVNDRFLDRAQASRVAIDARLVQLERIARTDGFAVAIGQPYPVTIERLQEWAAEVQTRGFVLAPLSVVAAERLARQGGAVSLEGKMTPAKNQEQGLKH